MTISFVVSCGHEAVKFDPQFKVGDYENEQIVNRFGDAVKCYQPELNQHACLTKDKLIELKNILSKARVPKRFDLLKKARTRQLKMIKGALKRMK